MKYNNNNQMRGNRQPMALFIAQEKERERKQRRNLLVGASTIVALTAGVATYSVSKLNEMQDSLDVKEMQLNAKDGIIEDLNGKLNRVIEERDCLKDDNNCLVELNSEYMKRVQILEEEAKEASRLEKEHEEAQAKARLAEEQSKVIAEFDAELTAYYPADDMMQGGYYTATGHDMRESLYFEGRRIIAMDKNVPLYSLVDITDELGRTYECIVLDRGGRIKGDKIDIVHKDKDSAYGFGVQIGKAKIVRLGKGE